MAKAGSHVAEAARHKAALLMAKAERADKRKRQRDNMDSSRARRLARRAEARAKAAATAVESPTLAVLAEVTP